ncbi:MAG: hypothetical protein Q9218_000111 [Villophora microphyllina]
MLRNKPSSSMQKTYDDCYLICSTAVYFEGQDNESEALRSWRSALDQIYYHNAYKVPPNYRPKNETEKALQDSLRDMEMQCKERVDILEALRRSRIEVKDGTDQAPANVIRRGRPPVPIKKPDTSAPVESEQAFIGQGTIPAVKYPDLSKPVPPSLPPRPPLAESRPSITPTERSQSAAFVSSPRSSIPYSPPPPPATLFVPPNQTSRTPSPDKKGRMLTTLRTKDGKRPSKSPRASGGRTNRPPAASKAAGLAWDSTSRLPSQKLGQSLEAHNGSTTTVNSVHRESVGGELTGRKDSSVALDGSGAFRGTRPRTPDTVLAKDPSHTNGSSYRSEYSNRPSSDSSNPLDLASLEISASPAPKPATNDNFALHTRSKSPSRPKPSVEPLSYRSEYPPSTPSSKMVAEFSARTTHPGNGAPPPTRQRSPHKTSRPPAPGQIVRRPVANSSTPRTHRDSTDESGKSGSSESTDENRSRARGLKKSAHKKERSSPIPDGAPSQKVSKRDKSPEKEPANEWEARVQHVKKHLPKGVDEGAARNIFNEIVVSGDEVHWEDVAGLDAAKKALKEAVVYPFLRPDLFLGLREPARGMLLFGPPGTGKTMLARAVATESRSTFFAISASSLTSKWLGESEKLVRALFSLAKALAPSIIFVDEIDSLLSSRGGSSEHESTRRIKTEFLIQWSDLQKAAAGKRQSDKEQQEGDASRVLVLAATNMPWAIDEAARRRFVRRQYIPLPESHVRENQLRTLLSHQKHNLKKDDIQVLVELTDGYSGSDITALAKDAAMGPLRSLGEALLYMSTDEIRPIGFQDFEASLINIRPSVSKEGLQEFEDWAKEFAQLALVEDPLPVEARAQVSYEIRYAASFHFFTTPPQTRKRSAVEAQVISAKRRKSSNTFKKEDTELAIPALNTPPLTTMDSDDEYNSGISSQEDFEDDEPDMGFSQDKDLMKPRKKAYEVDFNIYGPDEIIAQQDKQVEEVSAILGQPPEASAILLRHLRWNKERLIERYMDRPDAVLEEAGLGPDGGRPPKVESLRGFTCTICYDDEPGINTYAMKCGHRYCVDCYLQYLAQKVKAEGEAARIQCPTEGCSRIVDAKTMELLATQDIKDRYQILLTRTYVDDLGNLKWCPAPNCEYALDCSVKRQDLSKIVPTVTCHCKHRFCFGCTLNDHQPTPCSLVKLWLKKCEDDSETANWISANTKECPKCASTIEKNGGCNHMTCRKCKHEFCWICMGLWSEHGTSWYNCNRFEDKNGSSGGDQAKSRQSLERYLHYYNRYANHEQSAKLDKDIYLKTEKKMINLQSSSGLSWIEVQFLQSASHALQQCRQTLKWTYAFAFYLARNNLTEIFEENQKDLEMAVESLSEMFEKPTAELSGLKVDMMDKTSYCMKRRVILLEDTAVNLKMGEWKFIVDVKPL